MLVSDQTIFVSLVLDAGEARHDCQTCGGIAWNIRSTNQSPHFACNKVTNILIGLGASDSLLRDLAGNSFSGCAICADLLALFHNLPFDMGSLDDDIGDIAIADGMAMYFLEAATGSATTCVQCSNGCVPRHLCVVDQHVASVIAANAGGGLLHHSALLHVRVQNLKSLKQYPRRNPKHPNKLKAEANTASQSCSHKLRNYYTRHKTKATNSINTDRQIRKLS